MIQSTNLSLSSFKQCYKVCVECSIQTSPQRYQQQKKKRKKKEKRKKDAMCICKEKMTVSHMLLSFQHMQSYLPLEWSSAGHVHLSLRNLLL